VRRIGLPGLVPVAIAVVIALAGCTGALAAPHRTGPAPTPTSASVPARIPDDPALRPDVSVRECTATKGGWRASGRIVNRGSAHDYRVTVLFTTDRATVIGVGATSVRVGAGATKRWTVAASFVAATPTLCVLSGVA